MSEDADGYDYNDDGDIDADADDVDDCKTWPSDNLHGERCRRSSSDLDNCAGELPPLLHGPRAGLPCWRERECVKEILAKERVSETPLD